MIKTVTAKLAEDLKDAGFPQEAYFLWISDEEGNWHIEESSAWSSDEIEEYAFAAPTAEEILEQLPESIAIGKYRSTATQDLEYTCWIDGSELARQIKVLPEMEDHIAVNALAKMYLYLKKEGLL